MSYTFSIIGCQHAHIHMFIEEMLDLGHRCAGIYEPDNVKLATSVSEKFHIPLVEDREKLLGEEVHIVGCAAINNEKVDIVELCEQRGKHIMLDKPAVTSREGYERLKKVVARGKIQVGLMLTERFNPPIYTLKQMIERGTFGDIVSIDMRKPHRLLPDTRPDWHFSKEQSGGIVIDLFVHDFDLLRWLTHQEIASAQGYMGKTILPEHEEFYDTASLQVLMEGNVTAQLYADWHTPESSWTWGDGRIFVVGTKGAAELRLAGDPFVQKDSIVIYASHDKPHALIDLETVPMTLAEDFLKRIEEGNGLITHEDILATSLATVEADERVEIVSRHQKRG